MAFSKIELLPKEVLIEILFYLPPEFLFENIAKLNKLFRELFASSTLWEKKFHHHFPELFKQPGTNEIYSYKTFKQINESKDSTLSKTARRLFARFKDGDFEALGTYRLLLISITTSFNELNDKFPRREYTNVLIKDKNDNYQLRGYKQNAYEILKIDNELKIPAHWTWGTVVNVYPNDEIFNVLKGKLSAVRYKSVTLFEMLEFSKWLRNAQSQTLLDFCYDLVISEYPSNSHVIAGLTKLHWAVYLNQANEIIQGLSKSINRVDLYSKPPLCLAAEIGNLNTLKNLLAIQDVDVNLADCASRYNPPFQNLEYRLTPLHEAAYNGHAKIVEALLADERVNLNLKTINHFTAFDLAVMSGNPEVVRLFLGAKGCNLQLAKNDPLFIAARQGNSETVNLLLLDGRFLINNLLADGATPLFIAAQLGHKEVVELLLQCPLIKINLPFKSTAASLQSFAERHKVQETMEAFLQQNQGNPESILITPRQIAVIMGHKSIVDLFDARPEKSTAAQITLGFLCTDRKKVQPSTTDINLEMRP